MSVVVSWVVGLCILLSGTKYQRNLVASTLKVGCEHNGDTFLDLTALQKVISRRIVIFIRYYILVTNQ
jgi:hypothetical protein